MIQHKLIFVSNTLFSIVNFRKELIHILSKEYDLIIITAGDQIDFPSELKKVCYSVHTVKITKGLKLVQTLSLYALCFFLYFRYRPEKVLTFTILPNLLFCLLRAFNKFQLIVNVTGFGRSCGRRKKSSFYRIIFSVYCSLLNYADKIFVQNSRDARFLQVKLAYNASIIQLLGSGVNLLDFKAYPRLSPSKVLYLGRLMKDKGIDDFLHIATEIKTASDCSLTFTIAGSGSKHYLSLVTGNSFVEFLGHVDDVVTTLPNYDILLFCSTYDEGTPRAVLEALSSGMIVVVRRNTFTSDLKKFGFHIFEYDNVNCAMQILTEIYNFDAGHLNKIYTDNQSLAKELIDVKNVCNAYLKALSVE